MKRICLLFFFVNLGIAMFAFKPSSIPRFNRYLPADTIEINDLIGDTIKFLKTQNSYNDFVDNVSPYLYNLYPDTIIVHYSKKPLIADVDYFVLRKYESVLEYRDKKSGYYSFYEFNANDYDYKRFKRYEFRIKENDDIYSYNGIYNRYFVIKDIKSIHGKVEYLLKDLSKSSNNEVLFCPPKYTEISIVSNRLNTLCRKVFPSKLYIKSDYGGYREKDIYSLDAQIDIYNNIGVLDLDAKYGMSYEKISISKLNKALTENEYLTWNKKHVIDYSVDPYYTIDTSLVYQIANNRNGILMRFKGGYISQNVHRDDMVNKHYESTGIFWFAGIDTINDNIYYRVCECDKVFWVKEKDIEFKDSLDYAYMKQYWHTFTQEQKDYYFNYTKYFVCHKLHLQDQKEWFESMNEYKSIGILLEKCKIYGDEYSTGLEVKVTNMSNKTIKYIIFNIIGLNSVKDKVKYKGTYIQETRGIGPISPLETAYYDFEHLWWTDVVEYFDIPSINIEYTDGTKKQITDWKSARKSLLLEIQEDRLNFAPELKTNVKW